MDINCQFVYPQTVVLGEIYGSNQPFRHEEIRLLILTHSASKSFSERSLFARLFRHRTWIPKNGRPGLSRTAVHVIVVLCNVCYGLPQGASPYLKI
jgi:hypothetical protein